jgi:hypothetical protein
MSTRIISTIADLKQHIAIDFISDFDVIAYAVEDREMELRDTYLGEELFDQLATFRASQDASSSSSSASSSVSASGPTNDLLTDLLYYAQRAVANFAFMDYIPEGQLNISEKGIRIVTSDEMKTAFEWQIDGLRQKYKRSGYMAVENMLQHLADNLSKYTSWRDSEQHKVMMGLIIWSSKDFNKYFNIAESRVVFRELIPAIKKAEEFYIKQTLGTTYFDQLKTHVLAHDIPEADRTIINMIKPALAHLAIFMAMNEYGVDVAGLFSETVKSKPGADQIQIQSAEKFGLAYLQKLQDYLDEHASSSSYSGYYNYSQESDSYSASDNRFYDNDADDGIYVM